MSVVVKIISRDFTRPGFEKAGARAQRLGQEVERAGRRMKTMSVAAAAIGALSVREYAKFDNGLREIGTLMGGLTDNELKNMGAEIKRVGIEFGQSLDKMTKARYDIVSAGFSSAAESAEVLEQSAKLAVAGVAEVSQTADVLTSILNAYGRSAKDVSKVSDVLFQTVKEGKTTISEMSTALGRATAVSAQIGVSLESTAAMLATLTAQGINTDEAITSVTATMVSFLKPTESLTERIRELGFESGVAAIKQLGFADALKKITEGADETKLGDMFSNVRAMRAILPLAGKAAGTFADKLGSIENAAGATDRAMSQMSDSAQVKLNQMKVRIQAAMTNIGEAIMPLVDVFISVVEGLSKMDKAIQQGVIVFGTLTTAVIIFKGVLIAALGPIGLLYAAIGALGGAVATVGISKLADEVGKFGKESAYAADYAKGLGVEGEQIAGTANKMQKEFKQVNEELDKMGKKDLSKIKINLDTGEILDTEEIRKKRTQLTEEQKAWIQQQKDMRTQFLFESAQMAIELEVNRAQRQKQIREREFAEEQQMASQKNQMLIQAELQRQQTQQAFREEFFMTQEQRELQHLADTFSAYEEHWMKKRELINLFNEKAEEIHEQAIQREMTAFKQRNIIWKSTAKAYDTFIQSLVNKEMTGRERAERVWEGFKNSVISFLGEILKEQIAKSIAAEILAKKTQAAAVTASVVANKTIAASAAPAAYFTSVATFGAAAAAGTAALSAGLATTRALSLVEQFEAGGIVPDNSKNLFVSGNDTQPAMLTPGEAVIRKSAVPDNITLIHKMNAGEDISGSRENVNLNVSLNVQAIDSQSVEALFLNREFQKSFTDMINDKLVILKDKDGNFINSEI